MTNVSSKTSRNHVSIKRILQLHSAETRKKFHLIKKDILGKLFSNHNSVSSDYLFCSERFPSLISWWVALLNHNKNKISHIAHLKAPMASPVSLKSKYVLSCVQNNSKCSRKERRFNLNSAFLELRANTDHKYFG